MPRAIRVEGLRDVQRELRALDGKLPRELTRLNKNAAEIVASRARARGTGYGGIRAAAARTIRAQGQQRYAIVALGNARTPYAAGANFGAYHDRMRVTRRGVQRGWNQFPLPRDPDWMVYAALEEREREVLAHYERGLAELIRRVGLG